VNVSVNRKVIKDLQKLSPKDEKRIARFIFDELPLIKSMKEIPGLEKLTGYSQFYKVRFGDFRVGIRIEGNEVTVERVLNRKEIYRYFP
jgi:mRNA interferase RelE/StbE